MYKALIFLSLLFAPVIAAADISGRVIGVTDGDTIKVLTADHQQHKVRLAGIDAPEKNQAFGARSKQALSECVYNKQAIIQEDKQDRYKRLVGKVIVSGTDCNLRQIEQGMAWHYKKYQNEQTEEDRTIYSAVEERARLSRAGLWVDTNPIPPWEFRRR